MTFRAVAILSSKRANCNSRTWNLPTTMDSKITYCLRVKRASINYKGQRGEWQKVKSLCRNWPIRSLFKFHFIHVFPLTDSAKPRWSEKSSENGFVSWGRGGKRWHFEPSVLLNDGPSVLLHSGPSVLFHNILDLQCYFLSAGQDQIREPRSQSPADDLHHFGRFRGLLVDI